MVKAMLMQDALRCLKDTPPTDFSSDNGLYYMDLKSDPLYAV